VAARVLDGRDAAAIEEAAALLRDGGLVAIPTETVYGLAANALDPHAVARIFAAKQRPAFDPLIVHLADVADVSRVAARPLRAVEMQLAAALWPGPLTLLLPRAAAIPDLVTSGLPDVAVRVPGHAVARAVLERAGVPLAAPSANRFGRVSPTRAGHVVEQLGETIDAVLDGGPCAVGLESTVVRVDDTAIEVLRDGGVSREELARFGLPVVDGTRVIERPLAPGQVARHYATRTPLVLVECGSEAREAAPGAALLVPVGLATTHDGWGRVVELAPSGDANLAAARLFAAMRTLDDEGWERIVAVTAPETGLGRAINDRLRRAGAARETEGADDNER
jgi:L-threonylcarbamoyladenylate synthase